MTLEALLNESTEISSTPVIESPDDTIIEPLPELILPPNDEEFARPVGFVAPVIATVSILDYLMAADLLMNLEYRAEKLIQLS